MTRMTNDTFAMSELYHHGPEDIVIDLSDRHWRASSSCCGSMSR